MDERRRAHAYQQLASALGEEAATTIFEHLPPVGWADVATKHDLDELERRIDLRFEAMGYELLATFHAGMAGLEARLSTQQAAQTRTIVFSMFGTFIGGGGLLLAAIRLLPPP